MQRFAARYTSAVSWESSNSVNARRQGHMAARTAADAAPRTQAEDRVQGHRRRTSRLVKAVHDDPEAVAIIGISLGGIVTSWDRRAQALFGYRRREIVGRPVNTMIGPDQEEELRRLGRALEKGLPITGYRTTRLTKARDRIGIRMTISTVLGSDGRLAGYVAKVRAVPLPAPAAPEASAADVAREDLEACIVESAAEIRANLSDRERFARQLLMAQDEERRRLGRELHDSTGQLLVALGMNLAWLETRASATPEVRTIVADSRHLLERVLREVRTVSYLLHPPMLDEAGLSSAVRWYIGGFSLRSGIAATMRLANDFPRLARDAETALFRVLQESVTNAHRHSRSATIHISLRYAAGVATLMVSDRGVGFRQPPDSVETLGVGIPGMRERLHSLGGEIAIVSGSRGTRIRAVLPCRAIPSSGPGARAKESQ
jgi:PAS domain S-box-containing protein